MFWARWTAEESNGGDIFPARVAVGEVVGKVHWW